MGHSGPGSNGNEGVLRIPQSPCNTGTSPSDFLVTYPGVQLLYSTAQAEEVCLFCFTVYQPHRSFNAESS